MPDQKSFLRRHAVKLLASVLITVGVLYTIHTSDMKMIPAREDYRTVHWAALAFYAPLVLAMTWFRSVRWRFLLRQIIDVPKTRLFAVSCAGFLMILLLPFRLGELARPYMLRTRPEDVKPGQPVLTMTAATSSIVAERVIDGLFISIVLAIALFTVPTVHPLPDKVVGLNMTVAHVRDLGYAMLGLFTIAFTVIAVFYFARTWAVRATEVVIGVVSKSLADKLAGFAAKLADGLHVFRSGRDLAGFLVETTAYWGLNILGMWLFAWACGIVHADGSAITFGESCTLLGMLSCTILIPGPPGLLGVFQVGIYAGLSMYFPESVIIGPGAAYVFLVYVSQVILGFGTGGWGFWHEGGARRLQGALTAAEPT